MQRRNQPTDLSLTVLFFPRLRDQQGQGMVEFLIVLPVLLLLLLGAIQFALIYHAKITLNYAAFEGVRAGTLGNGAFEHVQEGFARGLAPLYSYSLDDGKHHKDDKEGRKEIPWGWWTQVTAFQYGRKHVMDEFTAEWPLIRIERLHPDARSFADFAPDNDVAPEKRKIPNSNLRYRSHTIRHRSDESVQDANLHRLRFTYWYPLYVPFVNRIIFDQFICCRKAPFSIFSDVDENDFVCKWEHDPVCRQNEPRIPLTSVAVMRMQTPARTSEGYYNLQ